MDADTVQADSFLNLFYKMQAFIAPEIRNV